MSKVSEFVRLLHHRRVRSNPHVFLNFKIHPQIYIRCAAPAVMPIDSHCGQISVFIWFFVSCPFLFPKRTLFLPTSRLFEIENFKQKVGSIPTTMSRSRYLGVALRVAKKPKRCDTWIVQCFYFFLTICWCLIASAKRNFIV